MMKRILLILLASLFILGCGTAARESGYYDHHALYKDWSHLWFSWYGYKHCTKADIQKSQERFWWGIEETDCPAETSSTYSSQ